MSRFQKKLAFLKQSSRHRSLSLPCGIDMSSNDYLGFRMHPFLKNAAREAIENNIPLGSGGSRLLRGHTEHHESLEHYAAAFFGYEAALYFPSGYQANMAIFTTLPSRHDVIIFDELIHASAREAIQNSAAKQTKVPHNDLNDYEQAIKKARDKAQHIFVAVEGVYSMDGDLAPLTDLRHLCTQHEAYLIIDEAHSTGVFGDRGEGLASCNNMLPDNLITLHTCGKALGTMGGLVCGSKEIIEYMINTARPFIYSTAPSPFQAHMVQKSLELCGSDDDEIYGGICPDTNYKYGSGATQRYRLQTLLNYVRSNEFMSMDLRRDVERGDEDKAEVQSPIIPLIIGDDARAVQIAAALQNKGFDIRAIRPPTVPDGTARLRLSLNAKLTADMLDQFFDALMPLIHDKKAV